jgi:hemerythrin-like domain-containing protein
MASNVKPIKRSIQLAPLSREHHDGLLLVWKLRQGIQNKAALDAMRAYTLWFWRQHIKPHFYQEEKILLPYLPPDHPLAHRLHEEHDQIRELILGLDDDADRRSIVLLADLLEAHIRFEERELYPFLEGTLSTQKLDDIFSMIEKHPVVDNDPPPALAAEEFWIKKRNQ